MYAITLGSIIDGAISAANQLDGGVHKNKTITSIDVRKESVKLNYSDNSWCEVTFKI